MKILVEKETNLVKYVGETLSFIDERQTQADGLIFGTLGSSNSDIFEKETIPEDFIGNKYKFIEGEFMLNENYEDSIKKV